MLISWKKINWNSLNETCDIILQDFIKVFIINIVILSIIRGSSQTN